MKKHTILKNSTCTLKEELIDDSKGCDDSKEHIREDVSEIDDSKE